MGKVLCLTWKSNANIEIYRNKVTYKFPRRYMLESFTFLCSLLQLKSKILTNVEWSIVEVWHLMSSTFDYKRENCLHNSISKLLKYESWNQINILFEVPGKNVSGLETFLLFPFRKNSPSFTDETHEIINWILLKFIPLNVWSCTPLKFIRHLGRLEMTTRTCTKMSVSEINLFGFPFPKTQDWTDDGKNQLSQT